MQKITTAAIFVLGLALSAAPSAAQVQNGPRIEVKQEQYDAGKVTAGTQVFHVFEIRNAGNEPLTIDRVQPS